MFFLAFLYKSTLMPRQSGLQAGPTPYIVHKDKEKKKKKEMAALNSLSSVTTVSILGCMQFRLEQNRSRDVGRCSQEPLAAVDARNVSVAKCILHRTVEVTCNSV